MANRNILVRMSWWCVILFAGMFIYHSTFTHIQCHKYTLVCGPSHVMYHYRWAISASFASAVRRPWCKQGAGGSQGRTFCCCLTWSVITPTCTHTHAPLSGTLQRPPRWPPLSPHQEANVIKASRWPHWSLLRAHKCGSSRPDPKFYLAYVLCAFPVVREYR
jgi:hypothetical protein